MTDDEFRDLLTKALNTTAPKYLYVHPRDRRRVMRGLRKHLKPEEMPAQVIRSRTVLRGQAVVAVGKPDAMLYQPRGEACIWRSR